MEKTNKAIRNSLFITAKLARFTLFFETFVLNSRVVDMQVSDSIATLAFYNNPESLDNDKVEVKKEGNFDATFRMIFVVAQVLHN